MELVPKNVLCFFVLVLLPLVRGGCKEQLMQNSEFVQCTMNFAGFFTNLGSGGIDLSQPDAIFNLICSSEGKEAFKCMLGYMSDCPDLMSGGGSGSGDPMATLQSIPGFDLEMFMKDGGLDAVCALMVGPCSEVKKCFNVSQSGMVKRGAPQSLDYYKLFHSQSNKLCGEMKNQMNCMLDALSNCPASVVDQVEAQFENAIKMSVPDAYGVLSYQSTKTFIQKECSKMPENFFVDACTNAVLVSRNFTECNENVTMKYSNARTCDVYDLSKQCVMDNVQPKCGEETAMFFARNIHVIFPGIPVDCASRDTSGSDIQRTSFGILFFISLIHYIYLL